MHDLKTRMSCIAGTYFLDMHHNHDCINILLTVIVPPVVCGTLSTTPQECDCESSACGGSTLFTAAVAAEGEEVNQENEGNAAPAINLEP